MYRRIFAIRIMSIIILSLLGMPLKAQVDYRVPGSQRRAVEGTPNNNNNSPAAGAGKLSAKKQRFNEAVDYNHEGVLENKKAAECWNNKDWDGAINHYRQAIQYYQSAVDKYPKEKAWRNNLDNNIANLNLAYFNQSFYQANDLYNKGLYHDAEIAYRKALEYNPGNASTHNNLALALEMQGQYEAAIDEYQNALRIDPNTTYNLATSKIAMSIHLNADANELFEKGLYREAELIYEKAIALNQTDKVIYTNFGRAQSEQKKYKEAEATFRKAIELDPTNVNCYFKLGVTLLGQGNLKEAEAIYRKTIMLEPSNADTYFSLGIILREEGLATAAITNYRKAIELGPTDPKFYFYLADLLEKQGAYQEAAKEYQNMLKIDPDNKNAKDALAKLGDDGKIINKNNLVKAGTNTDPGVQLQSSKIQGFDVVIDGNGKYFVGLMPFVVDGSTPYVEKVPEELARTEKFQGLLKDEKTLRDKHSAMQAKLVEVQKKKLSGEGNKGDLEMQESIIKQDMSKKEGEFNMVRLNQTLAVKQWKTFHEDMDEAPVKTNPETKKQ